MKSKTLFTLLVLSLFPSICSAELLIYKGAAKTKITSVSNNFFSPRFFLVYDIETGATTHLFFDERYGQKHYSVRDFVKAKWTVTSAHGGSYTVLSQIESKLDDNGKLKSVSIWMKGRNSTLRINDGVTNLFPRTFNLQTKALQMIMYDGLDEPVLEETVGSYIFMARDTFAANQANETFEQVIARIGASLEALGYISNGAPRAAP